MNDELGQRECFVAFLCFLAVQALVLVGWLLLVGA